MKKLLSLALATAMAISTVATTAFAANGNVSFTFDKTEVEPGAEIAVTINSAAKTISTDGFYVTYDVDKFEVVSMTDDAGFSGNDALYTLQYINSRGKEVDREFSIAENNASIGSVSFGFANTEDVEYIAKNGFAVIKFRAKSDASGTADFVLNENSAGASSYKGVVDTVSVTVKAAGVTPVAPAVTSVTIDPTETTVNGGESKTFTATVEGTDGNDDKGEVVALDKSVTWTATAGTIVDGVFTAPEATETEQTITVTATSVADATKSASATVTVPAKPVVVTTTVTVTDAKATQSAAYKSQNTMYWGVKISNGLKGNVTAQLDAGEDDKSKVTTLDFSGVTINGDAEFGVYTKLAAERLDKAIKLVITDVESGVVGESTAASYNSLQ